MFTLLKNKNSSRSIIRSDFSNCSKLCHLSTRGSDTSFDDNTEVCRLVARTHNFVFPVVSADNVIVRFLRLFLTQPAQRIFYTKKFSTTCRTTSFGHSANIVWPQRTGVLACTLVSQRRTHCNKSTRPAAGLHGGHVPRGERVLREVLAGRLSSSGGGGAFAADAEGCPGSLFWIARGGGTGGTAVARQPPGGAFAFEA